MTNIKDAPEAYSFPEIAAPTTPPTGKVYIYAKTDGNMYQKDDAGVETALAGGGGGIGGSTGATDNALIRADGTGGSTIQAGSGVTVSDGGLFSNGAFISNTTYKNRLSWGSAEPKTISGGFLNVGDARYVEVDAEGAGTTDDLTELSDLSNQGERILLIAASGQTITIKHNDAGATNKLMLVGSADYTLTDASPIEFVYESANLFRQISGGGGGANTALSNLASVAINTSLLSDTDNTDNLGSSAIKWASTFTNAAVLEERSAPSTPASGDLAIYANTDGKAVSLNDGGVSRILGTMTEIVPATQLGASQTTITLSSIPAHFQDLILIVRARSTSTGTTVNATFNADTGTNYARNSSQFTNAGVENLVVSQNQTAMAFVQACTSNADTAAYLGDLYFHIRSYAESAYTRVGDYRCARFASATNHLRTEGHHAWENVSNAITSIELNLNTGDFDTGTIYALYGIGTAS